MKQERMTAAEFRETIGKTQKNKMRNRKTVVDGILFDSKREADHYCVLKIMKQQYEIVDFFRQVNFQISDGYYKDGKWVRPVIYRADFVVIPNPKYLTFPGQALRDKPPQRLEIHEPKGHKTQAYLNKKKMFQNRYPQYEFIEI